MVHHLYTKEEVEWLEEHLYETAWQELSDMFNNEFNADVSYNALKCKCKTLGILEKHYPYTKEQDKWLIENNNKYSNYDEVADVFNKLFKTSKTSRGIQCHCVRILKTNSNRQGYKKGHCTHNKLNIGDEYLNNSNGYIYIKIKDTGIKNEDFISKQQYMWQKYKNKQLPSGFIVVFLNQDKTDFREANLYAIPRKINALMNQNHWFTDNRENTLTAIRWCELFYALKTSV